MLVGLCPRESADSTFGTAGHRFDQLYPRASTSALFVPRLFFPSLGDGTNACRRVVRPVDEDGLAVLADSGGLLFVGVFMRRLTTL